MRLLSFIIALLAICGPGAAVVSAAPPARSLRAPVLIFHHVKWLKPTDNAIERGLTVLPSQFETELTYLARNHYHVVTATRLIDSLRSGKPIPSRPVALTFDDGYADAYTQTYRLLRLHRLTATFFVVPGFLGSSRYLNWSQVLDMARHGMDIEAHTMSHPDLTSLPYPRIWFELTESRNQLQRRLRRVVRLFAYPYGAHNNQVVTAVASAGYLAAFTTEQGWTVSSSHLFVLPRVYVDIDDSLQVFAGRLRQDKAILLADPT